MNFKIRNMESKDKQQILEMMRTFYSSAAVFTNGSEEIFRADIDNCINENPYIEGYVFECENDLQGYSILAKSFSAEFGKPCIWIEDLYIKDGYRNLGIGTAFLKFVEDKYPNSLFRLEVEAENEIAVHVYEKYGYEFLPYLEMKKQ